MLFTDIIHPILDKISDRFHAQLCFGKPVEVGHKTFIPVAKISYGFGFGGGNSGKAKGKAKPSPESEVPETDTPKTSNEGGGGGGGGHVTPLGMFEISENKTLFIPIITFKEIAAVAVAILVLINKMHKRRRNG